jgi:Mrp family chromosome partitioning ATPase/capsular polysaccharide biosynthesis protein
VDLLRFARILRRRWLLIVGLTVAGAVLGAASTALQSHEKTPTGVFYKSTETLTYRRDDSTTSLSSLAQVGLRVTSGKVPSLVAAKLGGDADELVDRITVTSNDALGTLQITAIAPVAREADRLASTFSSELVASLDADGVQAYQDVTKQLFDKKTALQQREADLDAQIAAGGPNVEDLRAERDATADELRLALTQVAQHSFDSPATSPVEEFDSPSAIPISRAEYQGLLDRGVSGNHLTQVDENGEVAGAAASSSGPDLSSPSTRGALGAVLGFLFGVGIGVLLDLIDRRVRSREELEHALGTPVLAEIPTVKLRDNEPGVISVLAPYSRAAESFRAVRSAVLFELALSQGGDDSASASRSIVVMVVSGVAGEGKTTTTANLAAAFAEAGSSVLAVNGDFRRPALHRLFGVPDTPGAILESGIPGVHVVTSVAVSPTATPAHVVEAQRRVVQATRGHYDVILIDTAPLLSTNDAIEIAPLADIVVVVAQYGLTKSHHARRTAELLARLRAPVGGAVLVATPGGDAGEYAYYYTSANPRAGAQPPSGESAPMARSMVDLTPPAAPSSPANGNGSGSNGNGVTRTNGHPPTPVDVPALSWQAPMEPPGA